MNKYKYIAVSGVCVVVIVLISLSLINQKRSPDAVLSITQDQGEVLSDEVNV